MPKSKINSNGSVTVDVSDLPIRKFGNTMIVVGRIYDKDGNEIKNKNEEHENK